VPYLDYLRHHRTGVLAEVFDRAAVAGASVLLPHGFGAQPPVNQTTPEPTSPVGRTVLPDIVTQAPKEPSMTYRVNRAGPYQQYPPGWQPPGQPVPGYHAPIGTPPGWSAPHPSAGPSQQYPHFWPPNGPGPVGPPPKRSKVRWWMIVAAVLLLVPAVGLVSHVLAQMTGHHRYTVSVKPGQCVSSEDYSRFEFRPTDCGSPDAVYEFAGDTALGICPDGKRAEDGAYYLTFPDHKPTTEKMCFAANLHQGDCYLMSVQNKTIAHVDCAQAASKTNSTTGALKVSVRADGSMDGTRCAPPTIPMVYLVPQRVYCLARVVP